MKHGRCLQPSQGPQSRPGLSGPVAADVPVLRPSLGIVFGRRELPWPGYAPSEGADAAHDWRMSGGSPRFRPTLQDCPAPDAAQDGQRSRWPSRVAQLRTLAHPALLNPYRSVAHESCPGSLGV